VAIDVLFFGSLAEEVGARKLVVPLDESKMFSSFLHDILEKYPSLRAHKLLFSVNQEYATPSTMVHDGDEVAIFTPVSGG
jgi:molybdopterin converting factor small subunit